MSKKSNFTPSEPFVPKKHISASAPRPARTLARILLAILVILAIVLIVVTVRDLKNRATPETMSNFEALACVADYSEQDMVNLDQFLFDHGYRPEGTFGEFVYELGDRKIFIQYFPETGQVNVGDARGYTSSFGQSENMFICRLAWMYEYGEARSVVENPGMCDVRLSSEALAQIIRLAMR